MEGDKKPYKLNPGDCFLLTSGRPFVVASDLSLKKTVSSAIYKHARDGIATFNGGGDTFLIGARFHFEAEHTTYLFGQLPPVVYVPQQADQAAVLRWGLDRFTSEIRQDFPGKVTILEHLAPIMLVQSLRIYLSSADAKPAGWLSAMGHPQLGKAIQAMHDHPAKKWTVEQLGKLAGMSRAGFALKFKTQTGLSPLEYLSRWRMFMAAEWLKTDTWTIYEMADALGYDSESSFSAAFRRIKGVSPKIYQQGLREGALGEQ